MFPVFNPLRTSTEASSVGGAVVPATHGATGPGHVAFAIPMRTFQHGARGSMPLASRSNQK